MSTRKQVVPGPSGVTAPTLASDEIAALPSGPLDNIEVTALEIDEEFDLETDPYNRTGSHCVAALRRESD